MAASELPGVGIFGTEVTSHVLIPLMRKEGFHVEAIWGRSLEEAELTAQSLDIPFATNQMDKILLRKNVDLIVILCPPSHHSQIAVKALGIGKHVTVQPPCGLSQDETLRMVQAAQYYPGLLSTLNHGLRFLPAFAKMKGAIESGLIGPRVTMLDVRISMGSQIGKTYSWACDDAMGGGVLNLYGSHVIDLLHFLTGEKAVRVHGVLRTFTRKTDTICGIRQITADDVAIFQMEMETGIFATVTLNSQLQGFTQEVFVCGGEGHLVARNGDLFVRRGRGKGESGKEEVLFLDVNDEKIAVPSGNSDTTATADPLVSGIYLKGLVRMFRRLAQRFASSSSATTDDGVDVSAQSAANSFATFDNAQYIQAVIEAVRRSSRDRAWTKVIEKKEEEGYSTTPSAAAPNEQQFKQYSFPH